jgi:hypothetical protein
MQHAVCAEERTASKFERYDFRVLPDVPASVGLSARQHGGVSFRC